MCKDISGIQVADQIVETSLVVLRSGLCLAKLQAFRRAQCEVVCQELDRIRFQERASRAKGISAEDDLCGLADRVDVGDFDAIE